MDILSIIFGVSLGISIMIFIDPNRFEEYRIIRIIAFPNLILSIVLGFKLFSNWTGL